MKNENIGIYIHIPFCVRKCPYCGFYSRPIGKLGGASESTAKSLETVDKYIERLLAEINSFDACEHAPIVDSIFIGGGTPSIMPTKYIEKILSVVNNKFYVPRDCEITMEANPGTLLDKKLLELGKDRNDSPGINRLSIGVQSFDDDVLVTLGRIHSAGEAEEAFKNARSAGFRNINLDLMFGVPHQSMRQWETTLEKAIELNPEHISFYSLQIEEGTPYYESFMAGNFDELPEETDRAMYHRAISMLKAAGYKHYEISNASKPGFECRHNLKYWTGCEYIGFGDSAASYFKGERYIMMDGEKTDVHQNSKFDDMSEFVFTGLRLTRGIDYGEFKSRFGLDIKDAFSDRWPELKEFFDSDCLKEYVSNEGEPMTLAITEKGIDISNRIMAVFV